MPALGDSAFLTYRGGPYHGTSIADSEGLGIYAVKGDVIYYIEFTPKTWPSGDVDLCSSDEAGRLMQSLIEQVH